VLQVNLFDWNYCTYIEEFLFDLSESFRTAVCTYGEHLYKFSLQNTEYKKVGYSFLHSN